MTKAKREGGIGFRDFSCFNVAMLAKQEWIILSHPNDMWVMILKGIYFPNSSFFRIKEGC